MNVASINTAETNLTTLIAQSGRAGGQGNAPLSVADRAQVASKFGSLLMR